MDLGYRFELSDEWQLHTNATFNYYDLRIDQSVHLTTDTILEMTLQGQLSDKLNIIFGSLVDNRRRNEAISDSPIPISYSLYDYAVYSQLDYRLLDNLKLTVGAQYIIPDITEKDLVPRFGIVYNFNESWGIKLLHSDAFRSPGSAEQFLINPVLDGVPQSQTRKNSHYRHSDFQREQSPQFLFYLFSQ